MAIGLAMVKASFLWHRENSPFFFLVACPRSHVLSTGTLRSPHVPARRPRRGPLPTSHCDPFAFPDGAPPLLVAATLPKPRSRSSGGPMLCRATGAPARPNPSGAARRHHARAGFPVASPGHRAIVGLTVDARTGRIRIWKIQIISVWTVNQMQDNSSNWKTEYFQLFRIKRIPFHVWMLHRSLLPLCAA
ncbi:uncharacterized protein [Miscanthus floridulus]|uniref:uncharacterized protein n=1 Tax=Miscanthus floridulus TaxID=154761 RepID=UPI003459B61E